MFSHLRYSAAFFLFGITSAPVCAQMSGTYVIDNAGAGDYISFAAAMSDLNSLGVNGPVVMEVASGNYYERVHVSAIAGASATNTITFRGQALDSTAVSVIVGTTTSTTFNPNYAVRVNGAQHITFEHLTFWRTGSSTYGHVVSIQSTAADITFRRCRLRGVTYPQPSQFNQNLIHVDDAVLQTGIHFTENRMEGGRYAVFWRGFSSADEVWMERNVLFNSGLFFDGVDGGVHVIGNRFTGNTTVSALYQNNLLFNCDGGFEFRGNSMYSNAATPLMISSCAGTASSKGLVVNNFIRSSGTACSLQTVEYVDVLHNSFSGTVDVSGGPGAEVRLLNNSFYSAFSSAIRIFDLTAVSEADHNCYYNNSGGAIAFWNGTHYTVADLNAVTGFDANSRNQDPMYVDFSNDLHIQIGSPCAGNGGALAGVTTDGDDEARPQPVATMPDIGADETTDYCFSLNGTYSIGPSAGADFPSFTLALRKMQNCGITGPVVFEVEDGTYTEQLDLAPVPGNSAVNTVTFRGLSMDSSLVRVEWPVGYLSTDNHLLHWQGMEWVAMEHITFNRSGAGQYKRIIYVDPIASADQYLGLRNCAVLTTYATNSNGNLIERPSSYGEPQVEFEACRLSGGYYAMWWPYGGPLERVSITECIRGIPNQGVYFSNFEGSLIMSENQLEGSYTSVVSLQYCTGPITFTKNRLYSALSGTATGLALYNVAPSPPSRALIANNEFIYGGLHGVYITGTAERIDVINNSFHMQRYNGSAMGTGSGIGTDIHVSNNVFSSNSSYPVYINMAGVQGDHNCFHSNNFSTMQIVWEGFHADIAALNLATGTNENSIIADPKYFDPNNDLHAYGVEINDSASPFAAVAFDKDGQPRDPLTPDMGAYEFTPELWTEQFDVCVSTDPVFSNGNNRSLWIYKDRKVIGRIMDNGNYLGTINSEIYINSGSVRQSAIGQYYMDRNWHIDPQNMVSGANVDLRLLYHADEFAALAAADPSVNVISDAGVSQYNGPNENCVLADNTEVGNFFIHYPAPNGTMPRIAPFSQVGYYDASLAYSGEFYITTFGSPLPIELIAFTGDRINSTKVRLDWTTATELDNAGFEVQRMVEGEEAFRQVGWVYGAGNSQSTLQYTFIDANAATRSTYYRLRQVDHDGTTTDSHVIAVAPELTDRFIAYPNPAHGFVHINRDRSTIASILLVDASGRVVRQWPPNAELSLDGLASGLHQLQVVGMNGHVDQQRLVVY